MNNLFIVGAQRSGSTYLYQVLDAHPQVSMIHPVRPEPKFFMNEELVMRGRGFYERTYFADQTLEVQYLGEKSTSYIENPEAAHRIKKFYPDARILMILRDPVLRAYSNYRFSLSHNLETMNFGAALEAESERLRSAPFTSSVSPFAYRQRGHYMTYIEGWLEIFDPTQLSILILEEFANNLASVQGLYRWLGLDQNFVPSSLNEVINRSSIEKKEQQEAFCDLVIGYRDSIARLENLLQRRIMVWHENHQAILQRTLV